jgi:hypothetical protein
MFAIWVRLILMTKMRRKAFYEVSRTGLDEYRLSSTHLFVFHKIWTFTFVTITGTGSILIRFSICLT